MTISIVIPTYNGEKYIELALLSVLNQTRQADEIIISDDNSSDRTLEICQKHSDKIKIFKTEDGLSGFVNGWNTAISHASSEFISILHQDDLLAPTFLEEIENAHNKYPDVKHLVTPCNYIDENGEVIRESTHLSGLTKRYTGKEYCDIYVLKGYDHINRCPGVVTHRSIFDKCTYRAEAGHIADDDFFMRVGNYTDIVCIHKPLAFYREHSASETGHLKYIDINLRLLKNHAFQISEFKNNYVLSKEAQLYIRQEECKYIRRVFLRSLKIGQISTLLISLKYLTKAIIRDRARNIPLLLKKHN